MYVVRADFSVIFEVVTALPLQWTFRTLTEGHSAAVIKSLGHTPKALTLSDVLESSYTSPTRSTGAMGGDHPFLDTQISFGRTAFLNLPECWLMAMLSVRDNAHVMGSSVAPEEGGAGCDDASTSVLPSDLSITSGRHTPGFAFPRSSRRRSMDQWQ